MVKNEMKKWEDDLSKEVKQTIKGTFWEAFFAVSKDVDALPPEKISLLALKLPENETNTLELYNVFRKWLGLEAVQALPHYEDKIQNEMNNRFKCASAYTEFCLSPSWYKKFAKLLHFPGFRVCVQHLQTGVTAKLCYRDNTGTMQDVFMFATCPCCKIANVEVKPCLVTASDAASALNELFRLLKTYLKHNYYMRSTDWTLLYWPPELEVKQAPEA